MCAGRCPAERTAGRRCLSLKRPMPAGKPIETENVQPDTADSALERPARERVMQGYARACSVNHA